MSRAANKGNTAATTNSKAGDGKDQKQHGGASSAGAYVLNPRLAAALDEYSDDEKSDDDEILDNIAEALEQDPDEHLLARYGSSNQLLSMQSNSFNGLTGAGDDLLSNSGGSVAAFSPSAGATAAEQQTALLRTVSALGLNRNQKKVSMKKKRKNGDPATDGKQTDATPTTFLDTISDPSQLALLDRLAAPINIESIGLGSTTHPSRNEIAGLLDRPPTAHNNNKSFNAFRSPSKDGVAPNTSSMSSPSVAGGGGRTRSASRTGGTKRTQIGQTTTVFLEGKRGFGPMKKKNSFLRSLDLPVDDPSGLGKLPVQPGALGGAFRASDAWSRIAGMNNVLGGKRGGENGDGSGMFAGRRGSRRGSSIGGVSHYSTSDRRMTVKDVTDLMKEHSANREAAASKGSGNHLTIPKNGGGGGGGSGSTRSGTGSRRLQNASAMEGSSNYGQHNAFLEQELALEEDEEMAILYEEMYQALEDIKPPPMPRNIRHLMKAKKRISLDNHPLLLVGGGGRQRHHPFDATSMSSGGYESTSRGNSPFTPMNGESPPPELRIVDPEHSITGQESSTKETSENRRGVGASFSPIRVQEDEHVTGEQQQAASPPNDQEDESEYDTDFDSPSPQLHSRSTGTNQGEDPDKDPAPEDAKKKETPGYLRSKTDTARQRRKSELEEERKKRMSGEKSIKAAAVRQGRPEFFVSNNIVPASESQQQMKSAPHLHLVRPTSQRQRRPMSRAGGAGRATALIASGALRPKTAELVRLDKAGSFGNRSHSSASNKRPDSSAAKRHSNAAASTSAESSSTSNKVPLRIEAAKHSGQPLNSEQQMAVWLQGQPRHRLVFVEGGEDITRRRVAAGSSAESPSGKSGGGKSKVDRVTAKKLHEF